MSHSHAQVIIVGASITGLTLAHSLHKIGLEYIILEKRSSVTPQEGASVGILPNGARILDQLGLYDEIERVTAPLGATHIRFPDGFQFTSHYPKSMLENFGYPVAFLERKKLLQVLYNALPDKSKVLVNTCVTKIEQYDDEKSPGVHVWTSDGKLVKGDFVVGADGVHSQTRAEIWRMARLSGNGKIIQDDQDRMSAEYSCVFGISQGKTGLTPGEQVMRIYDGRTLVVIPSKGDVVFWFLACKLDRKYGYHEAPRFTLEDAANECLSMATAELANGVVFSDIWKIKQTFNMVVLEENLLHTWYSGRVVCIGDSIHKMTVNLGQGANCAIEDVAVLTNLLNKCFTASKDNKPTGKEIEAMLCRFNRTHLPRVSHIYDMSWMIARVHARDGFVRKFVGRYVMPYLGSRFESRPFNMIANAAALDFLPLRQSSFSGWEKYKTRAHGAGRVTVVVRMLSCFVLLGFLAVCSGWRREIM